MNSQDLLTPCYVYDMALLRDTIEAIKAEIKEHDNYFVHYAVKANANPNILRCISESGLGADCVSGGEIKAALEAGFPAKDIVFAGVGKADWEIELGLDAGIGLFNVESIPELEVINEIAGRMNRRADICFRINPDVGAHTHANITTGLAENKFGISMSDMEAVISASRQMDNIRFVGLHFHIGSQILDMEDFVALAHRINHLQDQLEEEGINGVKIINVGGGLGIDYNYPDSNPIPNFHSYFHTYKNELELRPGQELHFELGRSIVGQMGSLLTRVLYVKEGHVKRFAIVDAGFTDLIRPALYGAHHHIELVKIAADNTSESAKSSSPTPLLYDVVGPICESSDVFQKDCPLPPLHRGDLLAIRSAGAYGEIMASQYNCRQLPHVLIINEA
ncbi:MAG: diaminopimelate decarboxylase [Bacteroidaceae bacterium]|nr:diaminopimelate decarboxylase [Bacteroidaceae bacterium]